MAFTFKAPLGERMFNRFAGVDNHAPDRWWCYEKKKWVPLNQQGRLGCSSSAPCRTFKAFKRHIKKHNLKSATLVSRFVGHNINYEDS